MLNIRNATIEDETAVSMLLGRSYPTLMALHYPSEILTAALPFMVRANPALLRSGTYYIAESSEGLIVGCGGWTIDEPGTGVVRSGEAHIRHFATDPAATRRGVARSILQLCISEAKATGSNTLNCFAALGSEDFYASVGFKVHAPMSVSMPGGLDFAAVHMRLS